MVPRSSAQPSSPRAMSRRAERRGEHRVEGLRVLVLEEEVERGVEHGAVHRGGGEQARRDELVVRDHLAARALDRADERADADADRPEVEQRLREAGEEDAPEPPVREDVALDDVEEQRGHVARASG